MSHPRKLWGLLIGHNLIVSSWLPFFLILHPSIAAVFFQVFETVHIFWKHVRQNNLQGQSESHHVLRWLVTSVASVHLTQPGQISLAGSFNNSTFYCFGQIDERPHCHTHSSPSVLGIQQHICLIITAAQSHGQLLWSEVRADGQRRLLGLGSALIVITFRYIVPTVSPELLFLLLEAPLKETSLPQTPDESSQDHQTQN